MTAHPGSRICRLIDAGLDWRAVDGEVLALDVASSAYLGVNHAGAVLWRELARGVTREALTERLVAETGIDAQRAESDVEQFLSQLTERGLLVEEPTGMSEL